MKRAIFVGRYSPFHKGHLSIMMKKIEEGIPLLILVRDTHYDLYSAELRKRMIEATMAELKVDAKVVIIDDMESINYGRGVGYQINEIEVSDTIKSISATDIRKRIENGDESWREYMPNGADTVLENYLKRAGIVVWFTGLPKAGKKTIADMVREQLEQQGVMAERLDGGILRQTVSKDLGFSKEDRDINLERATHISHLLSRNGTVVLSSFITPLEEERQQIKKTLGSKAHFLEVFVKASVEVCKERDQSGMYAKAAAGEIKDFTGVNAPFEEPAAADLTLDTEKQSAEECATIVTEQILALIKV